MSKTQFSLLLNVPSWPHKRGEEPKAFSLELLRQPETKKPPLMTYLARRRRRLGFARSG